jgi:hypothetical protein
MNNYIQIVQELNDKVYGTPFKFKLETFVNCDNVVIPMIFLYSDEIKIEVFNKCYHEDELTDEEIIQMCKNGVDVVVEDLRGLRVSDLY